MKSTARIPAEIVEFLNALPTTLHLEDWLIAFRRGLQHLLADVDRVLVVPNTSCDLLDPGNYRPALRMTQAKDTQSKVSEFQTIVSTFDQERHADLLLKDFEKLNYPFHLYHEPKSYDYYYKGTAYLGSIFLFREKDQRGISEETEALMQSLEPFFVFALSDALTRHHYMKPVDRAYVNALTRMAKDAQLTPQDRKIVTYLLLGYSYKETAELLGVKMDTIKKHMKRIHQRTGARSQGELFAMYFTTRVGLKGPEDMET
jgi:DNA-binding CsgD family transcriptional regulator